MASDLLNAIAGLLAIMVVRTIATRQEIKHALLAAPKVPPTVELHPELETAAELCARGIMYYEQKDYERAMVNLDAAIRLDPDYGDAYIDRALIYYDSGDTGRAMMDIDRVLTIEPGNLEALVLRGKWRAGNGEREEAIQDLEKALAVGLEPPSLQKGVEALLRSLRAQ
jgi:tetratricopeptide (TPR) repeat protein